MKKNSNSSNNEIIALDNFKISYGPCYLLKKISENDSIKMQKRSIEFSSGKKTNFTGKF